MSMRKKYTKKEILNFLRNQPVMSIAISSGRVPRSSILIFAVDKDFNFYFATGVKSNKVKVLMKNKSIDFSIWEYKKILVHGFGEAKLLKSEKEIEKALTRLAKVAGEMKDFWPPLINLWNQDYAIFKVKSKKLKILDLKNDNIKDGKVSFTEINF
jgi:nitroimidazol reductase NimA-like FMN-containing flavoprotein (pyridoxamine 5'-phosphate oxidase superfamily)